MKNGELIDLRTEEDIKIERDFWNKSVKDKMFMTIQKDYICLKF